MATPHQMTRTRTLEHGAEEWACTECSRRLLFRRAPALEKIVLERGDEWTTHAGSTGGLKMSAANVQRPDAGDLPARDRSWLDAHGIEWGSSDTP